MKTVLVYKKQSENEKDIASFVGKNKSKFRNKEVISEMN